MWSIRISIVNLTNYSVLYKGSLCGICRRRSWNFYTSLPPLRIRSLPENSCLDHIWGYEYIGDTRTVDVHIKRLREKIRDDENWALSTVWGIGYKFEVRRWTRSLYTKFLSRISGVWSSWFHFHRDHVLEDHLPVSLRRKV